MGKSSNPTFAGDKEFEKIHLKEKFSYGLGDVACNVVFALTTSLLIYFKLVDCLEKCLIYGHIRRFAD